jgi:hypothetical protein
MLYPPSRELIRQYIRILDFQIHFLFEAYGKLRKGPLEMPFRKSMFSYARVPDTPRLVGKMF